MNVAVNAIYAVALYENEEMIVAVNTIYVIA